MTVFDETTYVWGHYPGPDGTLTDLEGWQPVPAGVDPRDVPGYISDRSPFDVRALAAEQAAQDAEIALERELVARDVAAYDPRGLAGVHDDLCDMLRNLARLAEHPYSTARALANWRRRTDVLLIKAGAPEGVGLRGMIAYCKRVIPRERALVVAEPEAAPVRKVEVIDGLGGRRYWVKGLPDTCPSPEAAQWLAEFLEVDEDEEGVS